MRKVLPGALCATLVAIPPPAAAQAKLEYPTAVAAFDGACLTPGFDPATRVAAIEALGGWRQDPALSVDVAKFEASRAIEHNYSFARPATSQQWSGTIDGKPARFVIASFDPKSRYPHLCALVVEDVANALPYGGPLRAAFKAYGIGAKSVDLVHYYEFAGKVGAEKHPVRGEVFSRSQVGSRPETMHMYVAF